VNRKRLAIVLVLSCLLIFGAAPAVAAKPPAGGPSAPQLVASIASGAGSAIGPGGALFVTENATGRIVRVDPQTGAVTTFASGLPARLPGFGFGGTVDVAFFGSTAYALVTLVGQEFVPGSPDVVGLYRVDGPNQFTVIADIGTFSANNPPETNFFVATGVQYALEPYRGGFLVADGHHNRVLHVTRDGAISEMIAFDNDVPTGLAVHGNTVYLAQAGPVPHLPQDGKVVAFGPKSATATLVADGAPLVVDVEFGRGRQLFALSQGIFAGGGEGAPASPNTGALVRVNGSGFTVVRDGLDRPTSLEIVGDTAYVVTYTGAILRIDNISGPPYGTAR
jgi:hypothetical protein